MNELFELWCKEGLARRVDGRVLVEPTFLEDVGTSSAENVRSAALKRWFIKDPKVCREWLTAVGVTKLGSGNLRVSREISLDAKNRIDLKISDQTGTPVAYIEVKWLSEPSLSQLTKYQQEIGNTPLILLSPICYPQPPYDNTPSIHKPVVWATLLPYLGNGISGELTDDLRRSVLRLQTMETVVEKAVTEDRPLDELIDTHRCLADEENRLGFDELFRRLVVTRLAEALANKLLVDDPTSGWRRAQTVDGPRRDSQSDVTPKALGDGIRLIDGSTRICSTFIRFHVDRDLSRVKVSVGTALLPYLEGQSKTRWEQDNPNEANLCFRQLDKIRSQVKSALARNQGPSGVRNETYSWYASLGGRSFRGAERASATIEAGLELARVLRGLLS